MVNYLEDMPSTIVLRDALHALSSEVLLRIQEPDYKAHFANRDMTDEDVVALLQLYPKVLQRPLVTDGKRWVVGRPI